MPVKKVNKSKQKQKQKQNVKVSQNVKVVVGDVKKKRAVRKSSNQPKAKPATNISLNIVNPYNTPNVMNPSNYLQYQAQEAKELRENHQKIYDNILRQQENRPVQSSPNPQYYQPDRVNWGNVFRAEPRAGASYAAMSENIEPFDSHSFSSVSNASQARNKLAQQRQYEQQLQQDDSNPLGIPGSITLDNVFQNLYHGDLESSLDEAEQQSIELPPPPALIQDQETQTSFNPEDYEKAMTQGGAGAEDKTPKRGRGRPPGRVSNLDTPQMTESYQDIYQKLGQYSDNELRKKQLTGDKVYQYAQQLGLEIKDPVTKKKIGARELKENIIDLININRRYPPKADMPSFSPAPQPAPQHQPSSKKKRNRKKKKLVLVD